MTHMWGLHAMSAILTVVGVGMLTFAILEFNKLEDATFYKLLATSSVVMLVDIAMILYSIFTILFYRFASGLKKESMPLESSKSEELS